MNYILLGIEDLDYVSKKTGKQVKGCNIYVAEQIKNGRGQKCVSFYLSALSDVYYDVHEVPIGSEIELHFNRFGNLIKILEA